MGYGQASDLAGLAQSGMFSLDQMLLVHLQSNHFPPIPAWMLEPCKAAIQAVNEGEAERLIELPEGATWRGQTHAPAWAVVEGHHLEPFLTPEEDPFWDGDDDLDEDPEPAWNGDLDDPF